MKETKHDYQNCLVGNCYDSKMTGQFDSWSQFKNTHAGFYSKGYDDTYNFVFRYDIHKRNSTYAKTPLTDDYTYTLELCIMLQRKGIYTHLYIDNITQTELDTEIKEWLLERKKYINKLWDVK